MGQCDSGCGDDRRPSPTAPSEKNPLILPPVLNTTTASESGSAASQSTMPPDASIPDVHQELYVALPDDPTQGADAHDAPSESRADTPVSIVPAEIDVPDAAPVDAPLNDAAMATLPPHVVRDNNGEDNNDDADGSSSSSGGGPLAPHHARSASNAAVMGASANLATLATAATPTPLTISIWNSDNNSSSIASPSGGEVNPMSEPGTPQLGSTPTATLTFRSLPSWADDGASTSSFRSFGSDDDDAPSDERDDEDASVFTNNATAGSTPHHPPSLDRREFGRVCIAHAAEEQQQNHLNVNNASGSGEAVAVHS
jgi:hypothetical protein